MNECLTCGKPCKRRWCSQLCHAKSRKTIINATCPNCGAVFHPPASEVSRGGGRFCSVPCRRAYKATHAVNYEKIGTHAVHRIVATNKLGRSLRPGEVVHHIDGNRRNNAPENLEVFESHAEHMRYEAANGRVGVTQHDQAVRLGKLSVAARRRRKAAQASGRI